MTRPHCIVLSILVATLLVGCGQQADSDDAASGPPPLDLDNGARVIASASCPEDAHKSTCPGADMPDFELIDFQDDSPYLGETYGLSRFEGKVTMVTLWAAWCGYCRGQAEIMEMIKTEVTEAGKDINFVSINVTSGVEAQPLLAETCTFPLLQDTEEVTAWELMGGGKDDMYIYGSDGKLLVYLQASSDISTRLATIGGYGNIRDALMVAE
ncbi:MAG: TlpA disulfide reductase family protein [Myxococcota bacterium]|nr:TlpA disulfide reductase family protein [Myxococcota bacterium]